MSQVFNEIKEGLHLNAGGLTAKAILGTWKMVKKA